MNQRLVLAVISVVLVTLMAVGVLHVRADVANRQYRTALRLHRRDQVAYLERSLDLEPGMMPARALLATDLMELGHYGRALHQLRALAHAGPKDGVDPWRVRQQTGEALYESGQFDEAAATLRAAILLRPTSSQSHLYLARTVEKQSDPAGAEKEYEIAIESAPWDPQGYLGLGSLLFAQHRDVDAARLGKRMSLKGPPLAMAWDRLLAQQDEARGNDSLALQDLHRAMQSDPAAAAPHQDTIALLDRTGQTRQAVTQGEIAVRLEPRNSDAQLDLAHALEADKQWDRAVAEYQAVEKDDPAAFAARVAEARGPDPDNPALVAWQERLETLANPGDLHLIGATREVGSPWEAGEEGKHRFNLRLADAFFVQGALAQVRKDYTGAGQFYQNALRFLPVPESPRNNSASFALRDGIETGIESVLETQYSGEPAAHPRAL